MTSYVSEKQQADYKTFIQQQGCLKFIKGKEAVNKIKNKETFWLYFGYAGCLHCQEVTPLFCDLATKYEQTIFYIDTHANEPDKIDGYEEIENLLGQYFDYDKDGNKQLFTPLILHFTLGKVDFNHLYTVEGHNVLEGKMNAQQRERLTNILEVGIIGTL